MEFFMGMFLGIVLGILLGMWFMRDNITTMTDDEWEEYLRGDILDE